MTPATLVSKPNIVVDIPPRPYGSKPFELTKEVATLLAENIWLAVSSTQACQPIYGLIEKSGELLVRTQNLYSNVRSRARTTYLWDDLVDNVELSVADLLASVATLANDVGSLKQQVEAIDDWLLAARDHNNRPESYVSRVPDLTDQIMALTKEFDDAYYESTTHSILVITKPVTLTLDRYSQRPDDVAFLDIRGINAASVNMGRYAISVRLPSPAGSFGFIKVTIPSVTRKRRCYHPHVDHTGHPCLGSGESAIVKCISKGDIFELFVHMDTILRNYNSRSPYLVLSNWAKDDLDQCWNCQAICPTQRIVGRCTRCSYANCTGCPVTYANCRIHQETRLCPICLACLRPCPLCKPETMVWNYA